MMIGIVQSRHLFKYSLAWEGKDIDGLYVCETQTIVLKCQYVNSGMKTHLIFKPLTPTFFRQRNHGQAWY